MARCVTSAAHRNVVHVISILENVFAQPGCMEHHVICSAVKTVIIQYVSKPVDCVLMAATLAIGQDIVTRHVVRAAGMSHVIVQHLTVLLDVWLDSMETHVSFHAVLRVLMINVTETQENAPLDACMDPMEDTVTTHVVSHVRNVGSMMQYVWPVPPTTMVNCVTKNAHDIVVGRDASKWTML